MTEFNVSTSEPRVHKSSFADYCIDENSFLKVKFNIKFNDEVKILDAEGYVSIILQLTNGIPRPVLLNFLNFNHLVKPKVLLYLAKNDDLQAMATAKAIVLRSGVFRALFKQYTKIKSGKYPIATFKTEEEALNWLKFVSNKNS